MAKLALTIRKTNIKTQKIDELGLLLHKLVIIDFLLQNKSENA